MEKILARGNGDAADVAWREEKVDQLPRAIVLYLSDLSYRIQKDNHSNWSALHIFRAIRQQANFFQDRTVAAWRGGHVCEGRNKDLQRLSFGILEHTPPGRSAKQASPFQGALSPSATRITSVGSVRPLSGTNGPNLVLAIRCSVCKQGKLYAQNLEFSEEGRIESRATTLAHLDLLIMLDELDQSITRLVSLSLDLHRPLASA